MSNACKGQFRKVKVKSKKAKGIENISYLTVCSVAW